MSNNGESGPTVPSPGQAGVNDCDSLLLSEAVSWNSRSQWERVQNGEHSPALPLPILTLTKSSSASEHHIPQPRNEGNNTPCLVPVVMKRGEAGLAGRNVRVVSRQTWSTSKRQGGEGDHDSHRS